MDITIFDFELPPKYIAQEPLEKREDCRLMVLDKKDGVIKHKKFFQIIELLSPGDLLVLNDSKVVPARLFGSKKESGGKIEVLLINPISDNCWQALLKPGEKLLRYGNCFQNIIAICSIKMRNRESSFLKWRQRIFRNTA